MALSVEPIPGNFYRANFEGGAHVFYVNWPYGESRYAGILNELGVKETTMRIPLAQTPATGSRRGPSGGIGPGVNCSRRKTTAVRAAMRIKVFNVFIAFVFKVIGRFTKK